MIKDMKLVGVWVNDMEKAYDFYVNKLGFTVLEDAPMGDDGRWMELAPAGASTRLAVCKAPSAPQGENCDGIKVGGSTNIVFRTADLNSAYETLKARGVDFPEPPTERPGCGFYATFADPDGNVFCLDQSSN